MQVFKSAPLRTVKVHYCAYSSVYYKPTHIFTNLQSWRPSGITGNGLCNGKGSASSGHCAMGRVINGRLNHNYTIARDSTKEFTSSTISRKKAKNAVPDNLTVEMSEAAYYEWSALHNALPPRIKKRKLS